MNWDLAAGFYLLIISTPLWEASPFPLQSEHQSRWNIMRFQFSRAGGGRELSQDPGSKTPTEAEARLVRAPHPLPRVVHLLGTQRPPQSYGLGQPVQEGRVPTGVKGVEGTTR